MSKVIFTYEDLKAIPENGKQYQILEGDLIVSPSPKTLHQIIVLNLSAILREYVKKRSTGIVICAPIDVVLSRENVFQPDALFISSENKNIITEANIQGAPDLVVEVLSEGTKDMDMTIKKKIYARFSVKRYWMIDPENKNMDCFVLSDEGYKEEGHYEESDTFSSTLFPELAFFLCELFE